jgi:trk system potassium uptake protein TrkH
MNPRTRALLATLSPIALCSGDLVFSAFDPSVDLVVASCSTVLLLTAAVAPSAAAKVSAMIGLAGVGFVFRAPLLASPMLGLLALMLATAIVYGAFGRTRADPMGRHGALGTGLGTLLFWLGQVLAGSSSRVAAVLLAGSLALTLATSLSSFRRRPAPARREPALALVWLLSAAVAVLVALNWVPIDAVGAAALGLVWFAVPRGTRDDERPWAFVLDHPERLLVLTFAGLCILGTLLLSLPQSSRNPIGLLDAAFTSVSAVCVTGLTVLDVGTRLSRFGQCALLLLIQVGGLGIMTLSTLVYTWVGRRMSLRHELAVQALLGPDGRGALSAATRRIVGFTATAEAIGTVLLTSAFLAHGEAFGSALFRGVFTAVSAFCNAGFALQADSLVGYADSPLVLHTVAALIVVGGMSPFTVLAVPDLLHPRGRPIRLQHLVPLSTTAVLLLVGTLTILAFEWKGTLAAMPWDERLHNAWFQSVTLRTAGFNSVDIAKLNAATLTFCLVMMFVGGSPGGTAGGIKTTTFALMVFGVVRAVRGQESIVLFKRKVSERSERRAAVTFTLAIVFVLCAVIALQLTQSMAPQVAVFEVVSALGTVGLTMGGTSELDGVGQAIIMACMFLGRVGGLSLLMFLSTRQAAKRMGRPQEDVDVG